MTARRSPSSAISVPLVVLMVCISGPENFDPRLLVGVNLDEILRAGQRQHRFDALLHAGQLQMATGGRDLPVEIHEAPDRRAVHVGDRREVDQDFPAVLTQQGGDHGGELRENRIHQAVFADPYDADAAGVIRVDVHLKAPVRERPFDDPPGLKSAPRNFRIWRASSFRPRLMRDFTVPSGRSSVSAISWYVRSW